MNLTALITLVAAFLTARFAIKKIIYVSHTKHLFDEPSEDRKIHLQKTPNLGGVGIFVSVLFVLSLFLKQQAIAEIGYLLAGAVILFTLGLTDDLVGLDPMKKLVAQVIVAVVTTTLAGYRIENLQLFGLGVLPHWVSIILSSLAILFLINAINLIDGINALAASVSLLASIAFAFFFSASEDSGFYYACIATAGALCGFLVYNITPAKIFMGDTGSLFLGFILSVFSIRFYNVYAASGYSKLANMPAMPAASFLYALLIIPVLDTSRVFILRLLKRQSPFTADRNHVHHMLLDINFSHLQATGILISVNISCMLLAYQLRNLPAEYGLLLITTYALGLLGTLWLIKRRKTASLQPASATKEELAIPAATVTLITPFPDKVIVEGNAALIAEEEISAN